MYNDPRAKDLLAQFPRQLAEGGAVDQPFQAPAVAPRGTALPPANPNLAVAPRQRPVLAPVENTPLSMSQQIARDRAFQDAMIRDAISRTGVANPTTMDYRQLQRAVRAGDITGENIKQKFVDPELEARVRNAYAAIGRTGGVVPTLEVPKRGGATADTYKQVRQDEYNYWADQLKQGKISPTDFQNAFLTKTATDIPTTDLEAQREYVNKARKALGLADLEVPKKKTTGIGYGAIMGYNASSNNPVNIGMAGIGPKIKPKVPKEPTKPIDLSGTGSVPVQLFEDGGEVANENDRTLRSIDVTPTNKKEVGHPNEYADAVARWGRKGQEGFANMIGLGEEVKFANAIPEFYFPKDEQLDGRGDAMRHMLLQAQIAKKLGRTPAEIASWIHETMLTGGQSDAEKAMDVANDARGMDIGLRAKDKADMAYQALQAIKSGEAKTIAKKTKK